MSQTVANQLRRLPEISVAFYFHHPFPPHIIHFEVESREHANLICTFLFWAATEMQQVPQIDCCCLSIHSWRVSACC